MKMCPVCKAVSFDDADICYGCLHRFDKASGKHKGKPRAKHTAEQTTSALQPVDHGRRSAKPVALQERAPQPLQERMPQTLQERVPQTLQERAPQTSDQRPIALRDGLPALDINTRSLRQEGFSLPQEEICLSQKELASPQDMMSCVSGGGFTISNPCSITLVVSRDGTGVTVNIESGQPSMVIREKNGGKA